MKDFMFLFRGPEDLQLTPEQSQVQMQKWLSWIAELTAKGRYTGGAPMMKEGRIVKGTKPIAAEHCLASDFHSTNWRHHHWPKKKDYSKK